MKTPMPTQLKVVRVMLFVYVAVSIIGLLSVFVLSFVTGIPLGEAMEATGIPMGLFVVGMLLTVGALALVFVAALRMGDGGRRMQTLLRTALAVALLGALINVLQGSGHLGLVLLLVALVIAETGSAKDWFASTEAENNQDVAPAP